MYEESFGSVFRSFSRGQWKSDHKTDQSSLVRASCRRPPGHGRHSHQQTSAQIEQDIVAVLAVYHIRVTLLVSGSVVVPATTLWVHETVGSTESRTSPRQVSSSRGINWRHLEFM